MHRAIGFEEEHDQFRASIRAFFEKEALPHLEASGGALINVGSEVSDAVVPLQGMYSASKHAVKGFTDALRVELLADESPVSVTLIR